MKVDFQQLLGNDSFYVYKAKQRFKDIKNIGSWFSKLEQADKSFYCNERITWLEIEGVPLKVWSHNTFKRLASKWGEIVFYDEQDDENFYNNRVCIKTPISENIFESFKVVFQGTVFWLRAKEVSGWIPEFIDMEDEVSNSDEDSSENDNILEEGEINNDFIKEDHSDMEEVPETIFEKSDNLEVNKVDFTKVNSIDEEAIQEVNKDFASEDPFNIYDILNNEKNETNNVVPDEVRSEFPLDLHQLIRIRVVL